VGRAAGVVVMGADIGLGCVLCGMVCCGGGGVAVLFGLYQVGVEGG